MFYLGLLMLAVAAQLVLGPVMMLLVRRATQGRLGAEGMGCFALLFPPLCGMALFSGLIWYEQVTADFSTGSDEYFWTPLGGGYFASSMSDGDNSLISQNDAVSWPRELNGLNWMVKFGCAGDQPVLALRGHEKAPAFVLVRPSTRSLEVVQTERELADLALRRGLSLPEWWSEGVFQEKCGPRLTSGQKISAGVALWSPLMALMTLFTGMLVRVLRRPRHTPESAEPQPEG